ncbi:hypothetical protein [Microvirga massiliensis]|uniref:hypothetical protein n=1 Tax=Microvirga massiliensis TaxID=1033741 RepID=UPI0011CA30DC|nr:hypothetical protein [Microvirga massiliensis]
MDLLLADHRHTICDAKYPVFTSFKTGEHRLSYKYRWECTGLIQMTFDSAIGALAPSPVPLWDLPQGTTAAFHAVYRKARVLLGFAHHPIDCTPGVIGDLPFVVLTRRVVLSEPRATTAQTIWKRRKVKVARDDRIRILRRLSEHPSGLSISDLEGDIRVSRAGPFDAILSLACTGLVCIDITGPLTPQTTLRCLPEQESGDSARHP